MQAIVELARRLGQAINESPQAGDLRAARQTLNDDPELSKLLKDYQEQVVKIARLEEEKKPVEVEDKQRLDGLQQKLLASEKFKKFSAAQLEYVDLMRKVNEALRQRLAETESEGD